MPEAPTPTVITTPRWERAPRADTRPPAPPPRPPQLKKLRLALILLGLSTLALVSLVFGMLMAVASELPALENQTEYEKARNSVLLDAKGDEVARLTGNQNRILLAEHDISPNLKNAVIAVEDRRFYDHEGVDYKGIARAFLQDLLRLKASQGGSTITQQFVKNALSAQGDRSVFQKMREAALAYHLERRWSKDKVLTQYLNSVYFGNGAYGAESAVRTYFRGDEEAPGAKEARDVSVAEAALLAGMISSPSMHDPIENPARAKERRDLVLDRMLSQGFITQKEHDEAARTALPDSREVDPPRPDSEQPYFSSWLTQQLVDRYRPGVVFGGGLKIKTTIDPDLQDAAEQAVSRRLTGVGPDASLVAIENKTGEVKAMVGGASFDDKPFNLATNGHRQPGSAFKPFTLIAALQSGIGPESTFASQKKVLPVPGSDQDKFVVNNYEDQYSGVASLRAATATSDNSVYAEVGLKVGPRRIARLAQRMGVRTPVSRNPAMILGGLKQGVTPLELAYAYSTIANKGMRVSGSLAPGGEGPVAIERVEGSDIEEQNEKRSERVYPADVGETVHQLLAGVVQGGTGKAADIGEFAAGKTGTTENYGDAWFCGFNEQLTVCVWIGYAEKLKPMKTEYQGSPVAGGTYPAEIFRDFMTSWINIRETREAASGKDDEETPETAPVPVPAQPAPAAPATPPAAPAEGQQPAPQAPQPPQQPPQQQPQQQPSQPPSQPQQPPAGGGGGTGAAPPGE